MSSQCKEYSDRRLTWEGGINVRDLGGLRLAGGGVTRRGALVRSGALERLTAAGWTALSAHGIRTVIDLRNDDERGPDLARRPADLVTLRVPFDSSDDRDFWDLWATGPQFGTPLYYEPFLERFPDRTARVMTAIAQAGPGGVLFHCAAGRDRAGLVALLLLALAGVAHGDIADDYTLSAVPADGTAEYLHGRGTSARGIVLDLLGTLDAEAYLRTAGVPAAELATLRQRLTGGRPPGASSRAGPRRRASRPPRA